MRASRRAHGRTTRVEYALPHEATSAGRARKLTTAFLTRPHRHSAALDMERVDEATLVVSELVTNATRHGGSGCRLRLAISDHRVTVEVHDDNPARPRMGSPEAGAESGRGLAIVRHLAESFEVVGARHGKTVRAVLAG
ncbi:ATP-binding protein [Streptomyces sp. NPDC050147]|uniref:ATP-binding protein n=1 Tax=Streptomyces sp. NPDC050147 TaxID=3155513 RepID=UPI00341252CC